ncbi:MAG: hypothetical protein ABR576_04555 [Thermoanaerobaculia bacterium]
MSKQSEYTAEEWELITAAPMAAATIVTLSDMGGPVGLVKEAFAVAKAASAAAQSTSSELIRSVVETLRTRQAKPEMPQGAKTAAEARAALIGACRRAMDTVARKSPTEAAEYGRWLVVLAKTATEAAKEGGFLGIGGTLVSPAETAAVNELASALGVTDVPGTMPSSSGPTATT